MESGQLLFLANDELSSTILFSADIKVSVSGPSSSTMANQRFIITGEIYAVKVNVILHRAEHCLKQTRGIPEDEVFKKLVAL